MERERRVRRGGLVGPLILIALGLMFLLNNLGLLGWSVWEVIFRLWPVLLIALGLDLLLRSRTTGGLWNTLGSILIVLVMLWIAGVAALMPAQAALGDRGYNESNVPWIAPTTLSFAPGAVHTEQISQPLNGAERAEVEVDLGVGAMTVKAMAESARLIEGSREASAS